MSRGDELIELLERQQPADAIAELQTEVARGYPVTQLVSLLRSEDPLAANAGAYIASELGRRAAPLLPEMPSLLGSSLRSIKFYALDVVLVCAGEDDGAIIAQAIGLIADADDAVRWKVLQLLTNASPQQLGAAIPHLPDQSVGALVAWLREPPPASEIMTGLTGDDLSKRLFAAAAAAALEDREISSFAKEQQELLRIRGRLRD